MLDIGGKTGHEQGVPLGSSSSCEPPEPGRGSTRGRLPGVTKGLGAEEALHVNVPVAKGPPFLFDGVAWRRIADSRFAFRFPRAPRPIVHARRFSCTAGPRGSGLRGELPLHQPSLPGARPNSRSQGPVLPGTRHVSGGPFESSRVIVLETKHIVLFH